MRYLIALFLLISTTLTSFAQQGETLNGKVIAEYGDTNAVYVINSRTEKGILTEKGGYFSINASVGDTILFSSVQYKANKVILKQKDFEKALLFVKMEPIMNQLREVMVFQYKHINAVAMGIIPKGQKTYTPAERKLNTASNPYMTGNVDGTTGGSIGLDPLFNMMSGRTAMLKKVVEVEKKEFSRAKTEDYFDESYFIEKLKIPKEYVKAFQFYIVEDSGYAEAIKAKNKTLARFRMGELAIKYLEMLEGK
jgi:hypothetical protein